MKEIANMSDERLYREYGYIPKYRPIEKGSKEWYLYHSRANIGLATPLITITPFMLFVKRVLLH